MSDLRLNLGSGSQHPEGYINIDLCEGADLKHDLLTPLPFEDNSVEEIMAIHLIESFYQWQFPKVLADWYRVLTPGGSLMVEFTVLYDTIKLYADSRPVYKQWGHWGLYGRQDIPIDPIVLHHYVYEVEELENLLKSVGFKDISFTKEGINHVPERDMRVRAYK